MCSSDLYRSDELSNGVPNLAWLVPMAQEHLRDGGRMIATIRYGGNDQAKEGAQ